MGNFKTVKKIHDLLIGAGLYFNQGDYDAYYHYPDSNCGFCLNQVVFNEDFTGYADDIESGGYKDAGYDNKDDWDTKTLVAFSDELDEFTILTIKPDGGIELG